MIDIEKFVIDTLSSLDDTDGAVIVWGKKFEPGYDLFAFSETDSPHDQCWVISYSRNSPDFTDATVVRARFLINVRSFNYKKARDTLQEIIKIFNGKEFYIDNFAVLVRSDSFTPTPTHKDIFGRMIFSVEFYLEARANG